MKLSRQTKSQLYIIIIFILFVFFFPSFRYFLPFLFLVYTTLNIVSCNCNNRKFFLNWFLIGLFARYVFLLIVQFQPFHEHTFPFYFLDDKAYHSHSERISEYWRLGEYPDISSEGEIGSLQTGYYRLISAIYYLFGAKPVIPLLLNPIFGVILCFLIYRLTELIFDKSLAKKAFIISIMNPIFWFWSSFLLKDILLCCFFVLTLISYLEYKQKNSILFLFIFFISGFYLLLLRIPSLVTIVITISVFEILNAKHRKYIFILLGVFVLLAIVLWFFSKFEELEEQIAFSFLNTLPDVGRTHSGAIKYLISGIPKLFLSPYAWVFANYFTPYYFLYPGQWFVYLYLLPFAISGAYLLIKENYYPAIWLIFPIIIKFMLFLLSYGGSAPRHSLELMPLIIVFACYGLKRPLSQRFMTIYYGGLITYMVAHFASIVWSI